MITLIDIKSAATEYDSIEEAAEDTLIEVADIKNSIGVASVGNMFFINAITEGEGKFTRWSLGQCRRKIVAFDLDRTYTDRYWSAVQASYKTKYNTCDIKCAIKECVKTPLGYFIQTHKAIIDKREKPVYMMSKDGKIVAKFSSTSGVIAQTGINPYNCLSGRTKTAAGYMWKYACDSSIEAPQPIQDIRLINENCNTIGQYTSLEEAAEDTMLALLDIKNAITRNEKTSAGFFVEAKASTSPVAQLYVDHSSALRIFATASEAGQKTGIGNIYRCLNGTLKSAGGYLWKYVN